jgi:hypothetical protein
MLAGACVAKGSQAEEAAVLPRIPVGRNQPGSDGNCLAVNTSFQGSRGMFIIAASTTVNIHFLWH